MEIEKVVQRHPSDEEGDQEPIKPPYPPNNESGRLYHSEMHFAGGKLSDRLGMTVRLTTRLLDVVGVNRRARVFLRKDVVNAVTTGTVGDDSIAELVSKTVERVFIGSDTFHRETVTRGNFYGGVTFCTCLGDVRGINLREGIGVGPNRVNPMTIRADGYMGVLFSEFGAVNAFGILSLFFFVAFAAGLGDVVAVDARIRDVGGFGIMSSVAGGTARSIWVARAKPLTVDALCELPELSGIGGSSWIVLVVTRFAVDRLETLMRNVGDVRMAFQAGDSPMRRSTKHFAVDRDGIARGTYPSRKAVTLREQASFVRLWRNGGLFRDKRGELSHPL